MKPVQRQAMVVTVKELRSLANELENEEQQLSKQFTLSHVRLRHLVTIVNNTKTSDTWKIEK